MYILDDYLDKSAYDGTLRLFRIDGPDYPWTRSQNVISLKDFHRYKGEKSVQDELPYSRTIYMPDVDSAIRLYQTHWRMTKPGFSRPLHDHPIFELNLLVEGEQDVRVGDADYAMKAGDLLLIKPGVLHRVTDTRGNGAIYFAVHFDIEDSVFRSLLSRHRCGHHPFGSPLEQEVRRPIRDLIDMLKAHEHSDLTQPAHLLKLMSLLFAVFAALGGAEGEEVQPHNLPVNHVTAAYRMSDQIEQSVRADGRGAESLDVRIAQLAENLGYSQAYLCRLFRKVFGISPRKYLSNITFRYACLELLNRNQTMERIAEKLGFHDGAHFSKQFKRWSGLSPSEYRTAQLRQLRRE